MAELTGADLQRLRLHAESVGMDELATMNAYVIHAMFVRPMPALLDEIARLRQGLAELRAVSQSIEQGEP